jgi:hypothetical protein
MCTVEGLALGWSLCVERDFMVCSQDTFTIYILNSKHNGEQLESDCLERLSLLREH